MAKYICNECKSFNISEVWIGFAEGSLPLEVEVQMKKSKRFSVSKNHYFECADCGSRDISATISNDMVKDKILILLQKSVDALQQKKFDLERTVGEMEEVEGLKVYQNIQEQILEVDEIMELLRQKKIVDFSSKGE